MPKGALLNKSIPEAIKLYLKSVAAKRTTREITEALQAHGVESLSSNFSGIVFTALKRLKQSQEVLQFEEYEWAKDRMQALFWVPDVLSDPDAIYVKKPSHGLIKAEEVYIKVFNKMGSKIKVVFVDYVGRKRDPVFITSFFDEFQHRHEVLLWDAALLPEENSCSRKIGEAAFAASNLCPIYTLGSRV